VPALPRLAPHLRPAQTKRRTDRAAPALGADPDSTEEDDVIKPGTGPTPTRKSSLYRLRLTGPPDQEALRAFVVDKYLDRGGFTTRAVDHDGLPGLMVTGTIAPGTADWCRTLSRLTGLPVDEENRTSLGLLLVRTTTSVYALTFGMGYLMIEPGRIDPAFGIEFAVRCLDEDRITKVRRQVMDSRGRTDENSATGGEHIRGFGIEQFGEIVSQISGQMKDVPLTFCRDRSRPAHLTGSDRSIKVRLGGTPAALQHDLHQIEDVCARPDPLPGLSFIAQVRPLKASDERIADLDERLETMLGDTEEPRIALAAPGECHDRYELAESFTVTIDGRARHVPELQVDDLLDPVRDRPAGQRLRTLHRGRIQMFADCEGAEAASRKLAADHWLTAELADDAVRYFYWQGQWYEIGAEYLTVVEQRITELVNRPSDVVLPPWPDGEDEDAYNKRVADQDGYVLLDQKTVHTVRFRGGGLEIADALGPRGELVCVKQASRTAPLNHLFAQGRVAVETLRLDAEARAKLVAKLPADHPVDRPFRTPTVVYGIRLKSGLPLTPDSLFAFAKVSLLHAATALDGMGARLEIVSIPRGPASDQAA
jgi:uncharacterized protein (TIGR04141 family)